MASRFSFVPSNDTKLLAWSANFAQKLSATPTVYGFVAAQATQYAAANTAFVSAMNAIADPLTRTKANMQAKDAAKKTLQDLARGFGKMIQANPGLTDPQRTAMGVTVPAKPQPKPVPIAAPLIDIVWASGWTVKVRLKASTGSKRGKPANVSGASVFSFVGPVAPNNPSDFKFEGSLSTTELEIAFPTSLPAGTKVWITAFWFNGRMQSGPACQPIATNLLGSGSVNLAA